MIGSGITAIKVVENRMLYDLLIDGLRIEKDIDSLELATELASEFLLEDLVAAIEGHEYSMSGSAAIKERWSYSYVERSWVRVL